MNIIQHCAAWRIFYSIISDCSCATNPPRRKRFGITGQNFHTSSPLSPGKNPGNSGAEGKKGGGRIKRKRDRDTGSHRFRGTWSAMQISKREISSHRIYTDRHQTFGGLRKSWNVRLPSPHFLIAMQNPIQRSGMSAAFAKVLFNMFFLCLFMLVFRWEYNKLKRNF